MQREHMRSSELLGVLAEAERQSAKGVEASCEDPQTLKATDLSTFEGRLAQSLATHVPHAQSHQGLKALNHLNQGLETATDKKRSQPRQSLRSVNDWMRDMDANGDGEVSSLEFRQAVVYTPRHMHRTRTLCQQPRHKLASSPRTWHV